MIIILLLSVGIISGVVMLLSNKIAINSVVRPLPTVIPSPTSDIREAVLGEDFLITMPSNPSTGYSWTADFDKNYLFLRSKDFVPDRVSPETVGAGGTEVFTFAPIKAGETIITMGYGRSWESKPSERRIFKYNITGKTAVDPRCSQKVISKPCACGATGYEFDSDSGFCHTVSTGCCDFKTPFNSLEECQKTCENGSISEKELKFKTIETESYPYRKNAENLIIKNAKDWTQLWNSLGHSALPPEVDFTSDMIIGVFQGEKSTGGYGIEINKIIEKGNAIEASVTETSPGRGCMVTLAFTSPFQVVKAQRSDKEVVFKTEKVITQCE